MRPRSSLFFLLPYIARYRARLWMGFGMVLLTVVTGMLSPWVLKHVVDDLLAAFAVGKLPRYAGLIVGIAAVEGCFRFWMRRILIGVSREVEYDLRNDFFSHLQRMSLSFLQMRSTGDIMSRATNDLSAVRMVLGPGIMYSMNTAVTIVIASAILFSLNWKLTLLAYIPLALASLTVKKIGGQIHDRYESIQEQFGKISAKAQENLAGIRVVKSFAREEAETGQFHALNLEYVRRNIGLIRLWGAFYPLMSALIGLSSVALLWYGGRAVMTGVLSLGEFVAVLGYLALLTWPTIAIGWVINILQRGAASMGRMIEISGIKPQIEEAEPTELPVDRRGAVEIRNLTFQYPNADRPALHEIDVAIAAGETLGIVGATGSGKSTLLNLLPRLYDPPCGTVHIDGVDVRRWPLAELRRSIACVPQDTFLFSATIAGNVAFGVGGDPKPEEIEWAARMAHLAEDVSSFPQAYQTLVGERGITLSGGQKQRVSLARALIASPKILILDDALSSVDTYTEERILENLAESTRGMTRIIVSHRVSTVKGAHQIVVLKNGRIVERGDHASLMALGGAYADLYQRQLLEEELAAV